MRSAGVGMGSTKSKVSSRADPGVGRESGRSRGRQGVVKGCGIDLVEVRHCKMMLQSVTNEVNVQKRTKSNFLKSIEETSLLRGRKS